MKKTLKIMGRLFQGATLVMASLVIILGLTQYTNYAIVTDVNGTVVEIEDWEGHIWEFEGDEYTQGQLLYVRFNNMGTKDYKSDDIIVDVQVLP